MPEPFRLQKFHGKDNNPKIRIKMIADLESLKGNCKPKGMREYRVACTFYEVICSH